MAYNKEAQQKYQKEKRKVFTLNYAYKTRGDVIEKLESVPSVNNYVATLVKKDIGGEDDGADHR